MSQSPSVAATLPATTRKQLAIEVLSKAEPVSHLATREQVSRKFLYQQKQKAEKALEQAFTASSPDPAILSLLLPKLRLSLPYFCSNSNLFRKDTRSQAADFRDDAEWEWSQGYRPSVAYQSYNSNSEIKKTRSSQASEPETPATERVEVEIIRVEGSEEADVDESELDEMWSYVGKKSNHRWLWHAIDRRSGKVLAYVFGRRKDQVFLQLQRLLEPLGIKKYCLDGWGALRSTSASRVLQDR